MKSRWSFILSYTIAAPGPLLERQSGGVVLVVHINPARTNTTTPHSKQWRNSLDFFRHWHCCHGTFFICIGIAICFVFDIGILELWSFWCLWSKISTVAPPLDMSDVIIVAFFLFWSLLVSVIGWWKVSWFWLETATSFAIFFCEVERKVCST